MWRDLTYTDAGNVGVGRKATSFKAADCLGARVIAEIMLAKSVTPRFSQYSRETYAPMVRICRDCRQGEVSQSVLLVEGPDTRRRATREGLL